MWMDQKIVKSSNFHNEPKKKPKRRKRRSEARSTTRLYENERNERQILRKSLRDSMSEPTKYNGVKLSAIQEEIPTSIQCLSPVQTNDLIQTNDLREQITKSSSTPVVTQRPLLHKERSTGTYAHPKRINLFSHLLRRFQPSSDDTQSVFSTASTWIRSLPRKWMSFRTKRYKDVILTLDIPNGGDTSIPLTLLYDTDSEEVTPSYDETLQNSVSILIRSCFHIPPEVQKSLLGNLESSKFFLTYEDHDRNIVLTPDNAGRYYRRCVVKNRTPHLVVHFPSKSTKSLCAQ